MAISLIVYTVGIALMPLYARNLLPPTVVGRSLESEPPMIHIALGLRRDNAQPRIARVVSRVKDLNIGRDEPTGSNLSDNVATQ